MRWSLPLCLVLAACPVDEPDDTFAPVQAIFDRSCASYGCHAAPGEPTSGLDLSAGASHAQLVDVDSVGRPGTKRVVPGDPDASWLWQKVSGTIDDGSDPMPPPFGLGAQDLDTVRAWIEAGAPE